MPILPHRPGALRSALISQKDLSAGVNYKASRFNLGPGQMTLLKNFILVEDGTLLGRRGTVQKNSVSLGAGTPLGAHRFYGGSGTNLFLVDFAGTVSQSTDGATFTSSQTGFSATSVMWFWQYLTYTYAATKTDAPQKFDGTTWSAMGIAAPTAAATAAQTTGGSLVTGVEYDFYYTYVTGTIESNGSPLVAITLSGVNNAVNLSGVTTGPAGATSRKIYAFKKGVSSTPQLVGTINDNTTTTFTVTTDQSSWTTSIPTTNNPPVTGAWLTVQFKNRLWKSGDANNKQRVSFSQIFLPEGWPTAFYVDIPFEQGDVVTVLFVLGDLLLVFGNNQLAYIVGDTPFSFTVNMSYSQSGAVSPWAVARVENTAAFLSRFGVQAFDGATTTILSDATEPLFAGILPQFTAMNYQAASRATMVYYDRLKALVLSFPTASGASAPNDTTLWFFLRQRQKGSGWVLDSRTASICLVLSGQGDSGDLYAWDATNGILYQWDVLGTYTDLGATITATFQTGALDGGSAILVKWFRWFTIRAQPGNYTLQVTTQVDQGRATDNFSLNLNRGSVYGTAIYGTSTYAPDIDDFEESFAPGLKGRTIQLRGDLTYSSFARLAELSITSHLPGSVRRRVGLSA